MVESKDGRQIFLEDADLLIKKGDYMYFYIIFDSVPYLLKVNEITTVYLQQRWTYASFLRRKWTCPKSYIKQEVKSLSLHIINTEKEKALCLSKATT